MADSGASLVIPVKAGDLRKGGYAMLKDFPCKIVDISTSKTGKHGHAKSNITGIDIFTGKKYIDMTPTSHNIYVPIVTNMTWTICDITEEKYCSLIDDNGTIKEDLKIPDAHYLIDPELGKKIEEAYAKCQENGKEVIVTVISAPANIKASEEKEAIVDFSMGKEIY